MNRRWATLAVLCCAAGTLRAAETSLNPDRWPSIQFTQSATQSSGSNQAVTYLGDADSRDEASSVVSVSALALVPVSDAWTVSFGAGTNLSHSQSDPLIVKNTVVASSSTSDNSAFTYQLGLRKYFVDSVLTSASTEKNPDRWPSVSLTGGGSNTLSYGAGVTTQGLYTQNLAAQSYTVTADFRAPLSDRWTVVPTVAGSYTGSYVPATADVGGSKSIARSLAFDGQIRYYFVGRNLISKDSGENPDQWTMVAVDFGGAEQFSGTSDGISTLNVYSNRKSSSRNWNSTASLRFPVTNHMTLNFSMTGQYAKSSVPGTAALDASANHTPTVGYAAVLKYYFFSSDVRPEKRREASALPSHQTDREPLGRDYDKATEILP